MFQSLTLTLRLHTFTRSAAGLRVSSLLLVALSSTLVRAKVLLLVTETNSQGQVAWLSFSGVKCGAGVAALPDARTRALLLLVSLHTSDVPGWLSSGCV